MTKLSRFGQSAMIYAQKFGWSVFPLSPKEKIPLISKRDGGRGCLDATDDPDIIRDWWLKCPAANVGIATGKASGFWVLDVDPRNGGDDSFSSIEETFGAFTDTVQALTGGGGRHVLFEYPEAFYGIKWIPLLPGLDCKGTGGYIVAPPSIHPSGKAYAWEASLRPGEVEICKTPEWLFRHMARNIAKKGHYSNSDVSSCDPASFYLGQIFKEYAWLGGEVKPGAWAVRCPSEMLHSCGERFDSSSVLFAPTPGRKVGWFHCSHSSCHGIYSACDTVVNSIRRIAESEGL